MDDTQDVDLRKVLTKAANASFPLRLQGLAWSCTKEQLKKFLDVSEDHINSIDFVLNKDGRPTGDALVELGNASALQHALRKHGAHFAGTAVEDARLRLHNPEAFVDDDADTANSGEGSTGGGKVFGCVRVRGLPFSSRDADVRQFFDGLTVRACMRAGYNKCAQAGEILLTKDGLDDTEEALKKHMQYLDKRYIEVFRSNEAEFARAQSKLIEWSADGPARTTKFFGAPLRGYHGFTTAPVYNGPDPAQLNHPLLAASAQLVNANRVSVWPASKSSQYGVRLHGLPYTAREYDLVQFFYPLEIADIRIGEDAHGRPNGYARVDFFTHNDAVEAMKRDRVNLGGRQVELQLESRNAAPAQPPPMLVPGQIVPHQHPQQTQANFGYA